MLLNVCCKTAFCIISRFDTAHCRLSAVELLAVFVMCEQRRGLLSPWHVYIDTLPNHYDIPLFWTQAALSQLPHDVLREVIQQTSAVADSFSRHHKLLSALQVENSDLFVSEFKLTEYQMAWAAVNTRCVHMAGNQCCEPAAASTSEDNIALVPFLDLFNHSPHIQVRLLLSFHNSNPFIVTFWCQT